MTCTVLTPPSFLLTLGHSCEHRRLRAALAGGLHAYPFLLTHAPDSRGEICAFRHVCRKRTVLAAPRQRKTFPGDASGLRCGPSSPACRFPAPFLDNVSRYAPGACCRGPGPRTYARPLPVFPVRGDAPGAFPAVPATAHISHARGHHENLPFPAARPDGGLRLLP